MTTQSLLLEWRRWNILTIWPWSKSCLNITFFENCPSEKILTINFFERCLSQSNWFKLILKLFRMERRKITLPRLRTNPVSISNSWIEKTLKNRKFLEIPQKFKRSQNKNSCLNFWNEAWVLSLRVFGLLSSSLLLFPQRFGWYILQPSSGVC